MGAGGIVTNDAWNDQYLRNPASVKTLDEVIGKAADIGLGIWLYDEYGFPSSGAANGINDGTAPRVRGRRHHFVQAERQRCWCLFFWELPWGTSGSCLRIF